MANESIEPCSDEPSSQQGMRLRKSAAAPHSPQRASSSAVAQETRWQGKLQDGSAVEVSHSAVEVRDSQGRLLVRFSDGNAEIHASSGDLRLVAPRGNLRLEAAEDIAIHSGGATQIHALEGFQAEVPAAGRISLQGSEARIETRHFEIDARKTNLRSERLEVLATRFHGWVDEACLQAKQYELKANQLVQQVRDLRQDVSEVLQVRAKRMHTKVDESAQLESKRSIFRSVYETTIEAKRVLLG